MLLRRDVGLKNQIFQIALSVKEGSQIEKEELPLMLVSWMLKVTQAL
jgi:hypothetical protein